MDKQCISNKKVFIFDVDGTLYSQRKMHIWMSALLFQYYLFHLARIKDLFILFMFRSLRERKKYKDFSIEELCSVIANKTNVKQQRVSSVIFFWILNRPLDILNKCAYGSVLKFIRHQKEKGKKVYIYSDYPANDKLLILGIDCDGIFTPDNYEIRGLKPDREAMEYIIKAIGVPVIDILYIGDRNKKDGYSARLAGIDYCDIKKFIKTVNSK